MQKFSTIKLRVLSRGELYFERISSYVFNLRLHHGRQAMVLYLN